MTEGLDLTHIPYPRDPWNEVRENLFQGGHLYQWVAVGDEFDLVVSLYKTWSSKPHPGFREIYRPIPDGPLTMSELELITDIIPDIVNELSLGKKVLVRCQAGYNRSGLVVAMTLMYGYGYSADQAIAAVREARGPYALFNTHFVKYLQEWESNGGTRTA